jgi:hypothetical protein
MAWSPAEVKKTSRLERAAGSRKRAVAMSSRSGI